MSLIAYWRWPDVNQMERSRISHPSLSTVTEDIRFSLQPVSTSKFTSCPKHCEKEEVKPMMSKYVFYQIKHCTLYLLHDTASPYRAHRWNLPPPPPLPHLNLNECSSEGSVRCLGSLRTCSSSPGTSWSPAGASGWYGVVAAIKTKTILLENAARSSHCCRAGS